MGCGATKNMNISASVESVPQMVMIKDFLGGAKTKYFGKLGPDDEIPQFIDDLMTFIIDNHDENTFKANYDIMRVQQLVHQIESEKKVFKITKKKDAPAANVVLKFYVQKLTVHLLPGDIINDAQREELQKFRKMSRKNKWKLRDAIQKIPESYYKLMSMFMKFLIKIDKIDVVRMCICWGPVLIRDPPNGEREIPSNEISVPLLKELVVHREKYFPER